MKRSRAIVLKTYIPFKKKIAVLDDTFGRIDCVPAALHCSVGALIEYNITPRDQISFIQKIEYISLPFDLISSDILFLHHVLEICFFYIPVGSPEPHIFSMIMSLHTKKNAEFSSLHKKVFIAQLFFHLGMYDQNTALQKVFFSSLGIFPIDTLVQRVIELDIEKEIDIWLFKSIKMHPYFEQFKTINFLSESE